MILFFFSHYPFLLLFRRNRTHVDSVLENLVDYSFDFDIVVLVDTVLVVDFGTVLAVDIDLDFGIVVVG